MHSLQVSPANRLHIFYMVDNDVLIFKVVLVYAPDMRMKLNILRASVFPGCSHCLAFLDSISTSQLDTNYA